MNKSLTKWLGFAVFFVISSVMITACGAPEEAPLEEVVEDETPVETAREVEMITFGEWYPDEAREVLGVVKSKQDVSLTSEVNGVIGSVEVELGDTVEQGDVLISFKLGDDPTNIQYQTALQNLTAVQATAQNAEQSAQVSFNTTKSAADNAILSAKTSFETATQTADANIKAAEVALQNAILAREKAIDAEDQNAEQAYKTLRTQAKNSDVTMNTIFGWIDSIIGISTTYESQINPISALIGRNNAVLRSDAEMAGIAFYGLSELDAPEDTDNRAMKEVYAAEQLKRLKQLEDIVVMMETLIRQMAITETFQDSDRAQYQAQVEGYRQQIAGEILSLETTLENVRSLDERKDQAIVSADAQVEQARASLDSARESAAAQKENARVAYENAQESAEDNLANAQAALDSTRASNDLQLTGAKSQLNLAQSAQRDLIVRAPFAGIVTELPVVDNQQVGMGTPLVTITNAGSKPMIEAQLTETEVGLLENAETLKLDFAGSEAWNAADFDIAKKLNPVTQKIMVEIAFSELPEDVLIGSLVTIYIPFAGGDTTLIPLSALSFEPGGEEVLVYNNGEVERTVITVNPQGILFNAVEVLDGLQPGQEVIRYRDRVEVGEIVSKK